MIKNRIWCGNIGTVNVNLQELNELHSPELIMNEKTLSQTTKKITLKTVVYIDQWKLCFPRNLTRLISLILESSLTDMLYIPILDYHDPFFNICM